MAAAAENLRTKRRAIVEEHDIPLRELYRTLELPGNHPLKELQLEVDKAVASAYGISLRSNPLPALKDLNEKLATSEREKHTIVGPGLPKLEDLKSELISGDCLRPEPLVP